MSVNDPYAMRSDSKNIIESYLARGVKYMGELFYTQLVGQRAVRFIQRGTVKVPTTGNVLVLLDKNSGNEQYVKIVSVESQTQTFTHTNNVKFERLVVTCEISEPLRYEFVGVSPSPYDPESENSAAYETMVADAAKYYGMKPLRDNTAFAASEVTVPSVYEHLVPSARIETAHVNQPLVDTLEVMVDAGAGEEVPVPISIETQRIDITPENQGYVYTQTLVPAPSPGTLKVSYMVQGKWYELQDNGDGTLSGYDASYGAGQLDNFGNLSLTLGALPDVESIILMQYAQASSYLKAVDEIEYSREIKLTLTQNVNLHAATITWDDKTATIMDGVISGDATGKMLSPRTCLLTPTETPASGTLFTFTWDDYFSATTDKEVTKSLGQLCAAV